MQTCCFLPEFYDFEIHDVPNLLLEPTWIKIDQNHVKEMSDSIPVDTGQYLDCVLIPELIKTSSQHCKNHF